MINPFPSSVDTFSSPVASLAQAETYYRTLLGEYYRGLPAVILSQQSFVALSPVLERFQRYARRDFAELWIFTLPNGGGYITTHLHQARPGVAFNAFLQGQEGSEGLRTFALQWKKLIGVFYAFRLLYVLTVPKESEIAEPGLY